MSMLELFVFCLHAMFIWLSFTIYPVLYLCTPKCAA